MKNIEKLLQQMTLKDKIALCSGASFWETKKYEKYGIPSIFMCDGPHGLRRQERGSDTDMLGVNESRPATCFPSEVTTAGSWDTGLLEEIGSAIGEEAREQGISLVLGPGANIKRNPLCGRNFEYFSEDPYLAGKLAAGFIRGLEAQGIGSSLKHFTANSQEKCRFNSDSIMDGRTLRELYLTAFEIAVKEGRPSTVMCAYPKLNGVHCSDHKELLTDILRVEWGFDGMVVTDWGAMHDRIEGFLAGCDLNMPGGSDYMERAVLKAVKDGALPESCVDASVRRILKLVLRAAESASKTYCEEKPEADSAGSTPTPAAAAGTNCEEKSTCNTSSAAETVGAVPMRKPACDYETHHVLARRAAEQGAVLLKNEGNLLPLQETDDIVIIGAMAKKLRYQGAGSSHINPVKISQPIDFLPNTSYAAGCDDKGDTTVTLLAEAAEAAQKAKTAVVFAGLPEQYESEGFDRDNLRMPEGHLQMIEAVAKANPSTVVVLLCGCVVECPWAEQVKAILYMGLPGQAGGEAVANLLYGKANPCGKLAESWPFSYEDVPSSAIYDKTKDALYQEGVYVGYRYYDKAGVKVRWPFGYGLSYTDFSYSDLTVSGDTVSVTVKNTGTCSGAEIVQLYVAPPSDGFHRPVRELKGFQKIFLVPGEAQTVSFRLEDRSFAVWQEGWKIPKGRYTLQIGSLSAVIEKDGAELPAPSWQSGSWYETCLGKPSQKEWEAMLGKPYTEPKLIKGQFTMDNTVEEMKDYSLLMKIMYKAVEKTIAKGFDGKIDYENPQFRMLMASSAGSPLRSMQISGGMKGGIMSGLLEMANGYFLRGIWRMIAGE